MNDEGKLRQILEEEILSIRKLNREMEPEAENNRKPELIKSFLNANSRNKIFIHKNDLPNIESVNIGKLLAPKLLKLIDDDKISLKAKLVLHGLLIDHIIEYEGVGRMLAIKNIGLLFESDLKIDVLGLFDTFSKGNVLFIKWEGEVSNQSLFFLSKNKGLEINMQTLSHITI